MVTGATGGVGMLALDIFSGAGFEVYAVSGKIQHTAFLHQIGATQVLQREVLLTDKPLASAHYGGGLDNVGGPLSAGLVAQTVPHGNIATGWAGSKPNAKYDRHALYPTRRFSTRHRSVRHRTHYPRTHLGKVSWHVAPTSPGADLHT